MSPGKGEGKMEGYMEDDMEDDQEGGDGGVEARYVLRFFFDWGSGTCLWSASDAAREKHGYPVDHHKLPIPSDLKEALDRLIKEHDAALEPQSGNRLIPPGDIEKFNRSVDAALAWLEDALGPEYDIRDEFDPL